MLNFPTIDQIRSVHTALSQYVRKTETIDGSILIDRLPSRIGGLLIKPEFLQLSGSFKIRGALNFARSLTEDQLQNGLVAFSGGNHAIAVSYVAKLLGTTAKVVMPSVAHSVRVDLCRSYGADVLLEPDRSKVPARAFEIVESENRTLIHPFDTLKTIEGTASLGYEFFEQAQALDTILLAIGGGGLASGVACAIKQMAPHCKVIGVQAESADAMARSLASGRVEHNLAPKTIADSLCPPQVGSLTLKFCQQFLDDIIIVQETQIRQAMKLLFDDLKIVCEGAGAVPLAALVAHSNRFTANDRVGLIIGGSSIDLASFNSQIL